MPHELYLQISKRIDLSRMMREDCQDLDSQVIVNIMLDKGLELLVDSRGHLQALLERCDDIALYVGIVGLL